MNAQFECRPIKSVHWTFASNLSSILFPLLILSFGSLFLLIRVSNFRPNLSNSAKILILRARQSNLFDWAPNLKVAIELNKFWATAAKS